MTGDPLDRIASTPAVNLQDGTYVRMSIEEREALLEVARAARDYVEQEGWHPDLWHSLRAALARLDKMDQR